MRDLTLTQEYLLCVINKKGKLPTFGGNLVPALTAAAVVELLQNGFIAIEGKKTRTLAPLAPEAKHLRQVYDYIEKKQPVTLENIVGHFNFSFSQKAEGALFSDVKQALAGNNCLCDTTARTLLGHEKAVQAPNPACVDAVIQKVRAALLEDGALDDATIALAALFEKLSLLKHYFSSYEAEALKRRILEIKKDPNYAVVSDILEYFETMLVAVIVAST